MLHACDICTEPITKMATGGGSIPFNKRSKTSPLEPSCSSEKIPVKCPVAGNGKVSNGNMVTNHESVSPRKEARSPHGSANKSASPGLQSPSNNRRTSQTRYDTLHVDVDLANRRFETVSPGRRCMSDSKLSVGKRQKNIQASSSHKRKLEFPSSASPLSKRRRSDGGSTSSSPASPLSKRDASGKHVDHNQNFKEVRECTNNRTISTASRGQEYKSKHSIGHRRASAQIGTLSEAMLTSPRKRVPTPPPQTTTMTLMSHKLEIEDDKGHKCVWETKKKIPDLGNLSNLPSVKTTTPSTPDSLSEDISDKFLKVDNDILFKKELAIDIVVTDCDGESQNPEVQQQDVLANSALSENPSGNVEKESPSDPHFKQMPSDSCEDESSVFTEDSNTTDDSGPKDATNTKSKKQYVKKKWQDVQPRAPRKRRIASLTAETKVHLLYEKDEVEGPKKHTGAKTAKKVSEALTVSAATPVMPAQCMETTPFTFCKHQVVTQSGASMPCAECVQLYYSLSLKQAQEQDGPLNLVLNDRSCVCGSHSCVQSESRCCTCTAPARTMGPEGHCKPTSDTNSLVQAVHSPMSAPVVSTSKRPTLVPTSMRRATVDTAECQKLTSFLKSPLMLRMSRHSTDGESAPSDMPGLVNETLEQLSMLQTGGMIPPLLAPPTLQAQLLPTTNHLPKSRIPRKILNTANLKPGKAGRRKSTNGWKGVGEPVLRPVVLLNDAVREYRYCYDAIRRKDDEIRTQDCVLLRASSNRRKEPAYVAKVASLWEDPDSGDLMMTLLWYYQPEHTEAGRLPHHLDHELFACRHWDVNSVACIEDRCYVLTPAEYSRYRAKLQRQKEAIVPGRPCVPENPDSYPWTYRLPPDDISPENVFLCRQVYDFRQKRVLKNPS
ncbi:uncharacterized protein LOC119740892 [Patiria miniata]|uniref:BAH domain-containing protein n=1 Tax=Patiria miniata TaxID=46514 RepID=A0A914BA23_PATMI|nr:uncharacterized protein LOC119740892 [Patiria miniata]